MSESETSEAPAPLVEIAQEVPIRHRRWPRWLFFGGALLMLALALVVKLTHREAAADALPSADVPKTDGRAIVLSERYRERMGLKSVAARRAPLAPVVKVVGSVSFDPKHVGAAGTRLKGFVKKVFRFEGDSVKQGELLAEIDSPELGQAQANVTLLRAQRDAAESNAKREADLMSRGLTTARELEVAESHLRETRAKLGAAQQEVSALGGDSNGARSSRLGLHQMRAPLDGTVVERHVNPGQSVEANLIAFRVANLDRLWVELAVYERNVASMAKGDPVELRPLATGQASISAEVTHIGEQVDLATRTVTVRVEVHDPERKLRPGQAVTAEIHPSKAALSTAVLVPRAAITYVDGKPTVFVLETRTRLLATTVELGEDDGKEQQILSGVAPGQEVVTDGVFALKSELFR